MDKAAFIELVPPSYESNNCLVTNFGVNGQTPGFRFSDGGGFVVTSESATLTKIITAGSLTVSPSLTFAQTFANSEAFANTVLIQVDGKIVAVGSSNGRTTLALYLAN